MEEHGDCPSGVCLGARTHGEIVSLDVPSHHPLLQLKRALPWEALCEVMTRPWRQAGKKTAGRPGLAWEVTLSGPLGVWMLVKHLHARDLESSLAEQVVARVCIGRQAAPSPQMRAHAKIARASAAWGQDGVEEVNVLLLPVAKALGFADLPSLSSETTAPAWPLGSPHAPGMGRGGAPRGGSALAPRKRRGVLGVARALAQGPTIRQLVQDHPLLAQSQAEKRQGWTRRWTEGGPWSVPTRPLVVRLAPRRARVTQSAPAPLGARHEVAQRRIPPSGPWLTTGVGAQGNSGQAGVTQARAIVRHQAGKQVALGRPALRRRLGGGSLCGTLLRGIVDASQMP